jgi:hypothetical protein
MRLLALRKNYTPSSLILVPNVTLAVELDFITHQRVLGHSACVPMTGDFVFSPGKQRGQMSQQLNHAIFPRYG